jgi:hypothetical protein
VAVDALSPPPPPPPPSSAFSFGKLKKNKRKGTAKLTVEIVEGPGELELAKTRKVKADEETIADATDVCTSSKGGASINTWSVLH